MGVPVIKVQASNVRTSHIFRKTGFHLVASYNVLDFVHEGRPYFEGIEELNVIEIFVRDLREPDRTVSRDGSLSEK